MFRTMYAQSSETLWYVGTWIFSLLAWNISRLPIFKVLNKPVGRNRWSFLPLTFSHDLAELPWMKRRCRNRGTDCIHFRIWGLWLKKTSAFLGFFLLFLLPYSSVPGTVLPFWCLLQSFLIRHMSAHKNHIENPEQHFYVDLLLGGKLPPPAPHSSPLTDHFGTALLL